MKLHQPSKLAVALAAGLLGSCVLTASPAVADPIDPYYTVINANSGKCLAIGAAHTANGADALQWFCYPGNEQRWYLRGSTGGSYRLVNVNSGKCLAIGGAYLNDGAHAVQWDCLNGNEQRWILRDSNGAKTLTARHSGKCLSIGASSIADGALAIQFRCWGGNDQRWYLNYHP